MASGLITSWQIGGETMEIMRNFILGGSKITAGGECSHGIKICLFLGGKTVTNLDNKNKEDINLQAFAQQRTS